MASAKRAAARRSAAPASLSKEQIVSTALGLIDRAGVQNFSMRNLAAALGVYPTAIYWYVASRDALLAEVVALILEDVVPEAHVTDWRAWLRDHLRRYRRALRRHPNLAPLIGTQLISNTGASAALVEKLLAVLAGAGFADDELVHAFNAVVVLSVGFAAMEFAATPEDDDSWARQHRAKFEEASAQQHPLLRRHWPKLANAFIVRWQNGTTAPLDASFEAFVDIAVAGLEQRLAKRK